MRDERFLSFFQKDKRSSILEYVAAERKMSSKGKRTSERIVFFRIGMVSLDKIFASLLDVVRRVAGYLYYKPVQNKIYLPMI